VSTYTELIKKFAHLTSEDLEILQEDVDYEYCILSGLSCLETECRLPEKGGESS
jgi:pyruvate ferredoxin oxidoreductase beta subunit/phenylglyoxylate dehydrogenase beta subunit